MAGVFNSSHQGPPCAYSSTVGGTSHTCRPLIPLFACWLHALFGSAGERRKRGKTDRRSTELSKVIRNTLEQSICVELLPRSQIDVCLQVRHAASNSLLGSLLECHRHRRGGCMRACGGLAIVGMPGTEDGGMEAMPHQYARWLSSACLRGTVDQLCGAASPHRSSKRTAAHAAPASTQP
jgi:hypothetical protein